MREVMRTENCKVRVLRLQFFIGMSVDYRKVFVVVFLTYEASRILAEGSYLIAERLRLADEL